MFLGGLPLQHILMAESNFASGGAETHLHLGCDQKEGLQIQRENRARNRDNGSLSQAKEDL